MARRSRGDGGDALLKGFGWRANHVLSFLRRDAIVGLHEWFGRSKSLLVHILSKNTSRLQTSSRQDVQEYVATRRPKPETRRFSAITDKPNHHVRREVIVPKDALHNPLPSILKHARVCFGELASSFEATKKTHHNPSKPHRTRLSQYIRYVK